MDKITHKTAKRLLRVLLRFQRWRDLYIVITALEAAKRTPPSEGVILLTRLKLMNTTNNPWYISLQKMFTYNTNTKCW